MAWDMKTRNYKIKKKVVNTVDEKAVNLCVSEEWQRGGGIEGK